MEKKRFNLPIEFLACIDVYGVVRTISHKISIARMMLDHTPSQNDLTRAMRSNSDIVNTTNIFVDVKYETCSFVRMKI